MSTATFYHAGCPVCLSAEQMLISALDKNQYTLESIHLGEQKDKIAEAQLKGVKSVPALLLNGEVFHINFGAALSDLQA